MKLGKKIKSIVAVCLASLCMVVMPVMSASAEGEGQEGVNDSADSVESGAYDALISAINEGKAGSEDVSGNEYIMSEGGTLNYSKLVTQSGIVNETTFNKLKSSEKEKLLTDMIKVANAKVEEDAPEDSLSKVTDNTITNWMNALQHCDGIGSQLMNSILQNTKPDYATANKIYEPFSGVVGTCLGLGAVLLMAFLAITMVLDLSYIGIPAFRLMCNGGSDGKTDKPKFISHEAVSAVEAAEGGGGGSGQNGGTEKVAVGIYFKKRVIMLVLLGICLLYLIQGQIFTLVSMILDLVSGFFGF